jgi:threonine dehydrogenase-like Zn-dependent dehydrogenase
VGELADGSRVVGEINAYDATCETCRRGDVTQCENRTVLGIFRRDGAMAEYVTLPARGTLVLKSTFHGVHPLALAPLVVDEVTLVGSRCGPFPPAMRLLEQHLIEVDALLDAEYPLAHGIEAFARASAPGALKVQLVMEGGCV